MPVNQSYQQGPTPPAADNSLRHATTAFLATYALRGDISQPWSSAYQAQAQANIGLGPPVAVSAAGTTQATATVLAAAVNVVTTAASGSGVILSGLGRQEVMSAGANAVSVYPVSGAAIYVNGSLLSTNAPATLQPGNHATYLTIVSGNTTTHYEAP